MRVVRRLLLGLSIVVAAGALALWLWLPPVNVPLRGLLANQFPSLFTPPQVDANTNPACWAASNNVVFGATSIRLPIGSKSTW